MPAGKPFKENPNLLGGDSSRNAPNMPMVPHPVRPASPGIQQIDWPAAKPLEQDSKKPFNVK